MSGLGFRRSLAGWIGGAAWIALVVMPTVAEEPAASPGKSGGQAASVEPSKEQPKPADAKQGPTLAPPKNGTSPGAKSEGDADGAKGPEKSPSGSAASNAVPDRLPDNPATSKEGGAKSILEVLPDGPPDEPAAEEEPGPKKEPVASHPKGESLQPIPEGAAAGPAEIETASFNGVTPGASTMADVKKAWGVPKEMRKHQGTIVHLYSVDPFDQVEVVFYEDKVTSVVIRLNQAFPADAVARQLTLSTFRPVLVSNEKGEILGQSYPERGVLFSFAPSETPGKPTMKVAQIILEAVTAEPFVLRAETDLDTQTAASLKDLEVAVKLAPQNARARWLQARALLLTGDGNKALAASEEAVRLDPKNGQFLLTHAQVLGQLGRFREATERAEQAVSLSEKRPFVAARALCLIGDLANSAPQPDYKRAMQYHSQAIKKAEAIAGDPHPAVRLPAKEVLVDAHLGAAHDIAWGSWNNKELAAAAWMKRASEFADDFIRNDGGTAELRLRVAARGLAACVGLQGKADPAAWADQAIRVGKELADQAATPSQKQAIQRELGTALYDAVQVSQMRGDRDAVEKYGRQAIQALESLKPSKDRPADVYLLGRLYFRMGAVRSGGDQDHRAAVAWFDKAIATLEPVLSTALSSERARLGETLVTMGVSYWETGQQEKALQISQQGVDMMEKAVADGSLPTSVLEVPYKNLATMHRQMGQDDKAQRYAEKASFKTETIRQ